MRPAISAALAPPPSAGRAVSSAWTVDTLSLVLYPMPTAAIPLSDVAKLEVSGGTQGHARAPGP